MVHLLPGECGAFGEIGAYRVTMAVDELMVAFTQESHEQLCDSYDECPNVAVWRVVVEKLHPRCTGMMVCEPCRREIMEFLQPFIQRGVYELECYRCHESMGKFVGVERLRG